jgi:hypothetical protein
LFSGGEYGTGLHAASLKGDIAVVQLLLEVPGADPNRIGKSFNIVGTAVQELIHEQVKNMAQYFGLHLERGTLKL